MPVKIYRKKGSDIYHFTGTVAGRRLRGSTRTADKARAERIAAKKENAEWERHLDGPSSVLTFPQAVELYLKAVDLNRRQLKYIERLEDYWKNTKVKDMTTGAIRQSAIEIYPKASGATRNRQAVTPTQAIINHCATLDLCAPVKVGRFTFEKQIKQPVTIEWLDTFCAHARPLIVALATTMFATGCRISDAMRLEWSQIDFHRRTIAIRKTKAKRQRFAHMPQRLLVALANLPRDQKPFYWSETRLREFWDEDIAKTAEAVPGFDRLTFHSCRHGVTTMLLHLGYDPVTTGKLVGMSADQVIRTYGHAKDDPTLTERLFDNWQVSDTSKTGNGAND